MIIGVIPARFGSSRLPGKPLLKFGDHTMIQKVYIQASKSKLLKKIYVLTDDDRIKKSIENINGKVLMIKEDCINGTERICVAFKKFPEIFCKTTHVVNIQGDEPYINPNHIDIAIQNMKNKKNKDVVCSTLHFKIKKTEELNDISIGKLVLDHNNYILYCSRNCIPYNKNKILDINKCDYYGHIGLFVYDIQYLKNFYMKENTKLQLEEDIEWLKILEQGFKIISYGVENYEIGVNTIKDYNYLIKKYL